MGQFRDTVPKKLTNIEEVTNQMARWLNLTVKLMIWLLVCCVLYFVIVTLMILQILLG
jgi:hypothetical protein